MQSKKASRFLKIKIIYKTVGSKSRDSNTHKWPDRSSSWMKPTGSDCYGDWSKQENGSCLRGTAIAQLQVTMYGLYGMWTESKHNFTFFQEKLKILYLTVWQQNKKKIYRTEIIHEAF